MIRLTRSRRAADLPADFTGDKLVTKLIALATARHELKDEIEFDVSIGDWKKTKDVLKVESLGKCAYCEADTSLVAHGDVEHFRPKSVYWWLALCLDNYVYSCQICNQSYKSDEFPIAGSRLKWPKLPARLPTSQKGLERLAGRLLNPDPATTSEADLIELCGSEKADLPHPYLEDPELLFGWRVSETNQEVHLVEPTRASPKAKRAVRAADQYLGLNREEHTRKRYQLYFVLNTLLRQWVKDGRPPTGEIFDALARLCSPAYAYTAMNRYFAREAGFPA